MIKGATVRGLTAVLVDVQVGLRPGNAFRVVGLGQTAVQEARERLIHAFDASGFEWPDAAVTVNLAPGDVPKEGTTLDLAMALAVTSIEVIPGRERPRESSGKGASEVASG